MSRAWTVMLVVILVSLEAGFVAWAVYTTFIGGTTSGPNFVQAVKSGSVSPGAISSIEVVEPAVGHTPFTASEYDSLPRRTRIDDRASITRLLTLLKRSLPGRIHQNHPSSTYNVYLKVTCQDSFFWLYVDVFEDAQSAVFTLKANTRNAVNPNGASAYHLDNFAEVLSLLRHNESTQPDEAANGSPVGSLED